MGYTRKIFCGSLVEGISELNNLFLHVYPNPVGNVLQIETNGLFGKEAQVLIYSMDGKQVFKTGYSNRMHINTETLPSGMYSLVVFDEKNYVREKVLIRH